MDTRGDTAESHGKLTQEPQHPGMTAIFIGVLLS